MHINYQYQLHWAITHTALNRSATILDYGCGSGEVVIAGRKQGLNIYGADIYYDGGSDLVNVKGSGIFGDIIHKIKNNHLDFQDDYFDLVMSNQVMEHVDSLDLVLTEIHRTMKPGGKFLSIFPILETIPENHIGIPFAHWFAKESPLRTPYVCIMRMLGFGVHKGDLSANQWTERQLDWLDRFTHYRRLKKIVTYFKRYFKVSWYENDYIRFRLTQKIGEFNHGFFNHPLIQKTMSCAFHRLAGTVLLCEK